MLGRAGRVVKDGRGRLAEKLASENEGGEEHCRQRGQNMLRPWGHLGDRAQWEARQQQRRSEERCGWMCRSF